MSLLTLLPPDEPPLPMGSGLCQAFMTQMDPRLGAVGSGQFSSNAFQVLLCLDR